MVMPIMNKTHSKIAELNAQRTGYKGSIKGDTTKSDGMPRKCMDVSRRNALGYTH